MPVEVQTVEYSYLGDGVSTVFEFPSRFLSNDDLFVALNGVIQVAGFTITGAGSDLGGSVTFAVAPALAVRVMIVRNPSPSQLIDFKNGQTVLEGTLDNALDKLTMIAQYLLRSARRSVRIGDAIYTTEPTNLLELPAVADRTYKLFAFNNSGGVELVDRIPYDNIAAATTFSRLYLGEYSFFPSDVDVGFAIQDGALVSIVDQIDPDDNGLYVRDNGLWRLASVLPAGVQRRGFYVVPTDGLTSVPVSGNYVVGQIDVFLNGLRVRLGPSPGVGDNSVPGATASDNANIVFPAGLLAAGDLVEWIVTRAFSVADIAAVDVNFVPAGGLASTNVQAALQELDAEKAPLASPTLTGAPLAPTPATGDSSTKIATTALVDAKIAAIPSVAAPTILDPGFYFTGTVAANALTVTLKLPNGADPSVASPLTFKVQSTSATAGLQTTLTINAPTSFTVPSGATLGATANRPFRLRLVLFNDAGTPRLGIINPRTGLTIATVRNNQLASSTAISGTSNSGAAFYTGSAVTTKPYIVLGYLDYASGLATPGTWLSAPTTVQVQSEGVPFTGDVIFSQSIYEATGSTSTSTAYAAVNNTTQNFTLSAAMNAFRVHYSATVQVLAGGAGTNTSGTVNVFRGATDLGVSQTVANTSGGGTNVNQSGAFSRSLIDFPGDTGAANYSLQHKRDSGGTMTTSLICTELQEISL